MLLLQSLQVRMPVERGRAEDEGRTFTGVLQ